MACPPAITDQDIRDYNAEKYRRYGDPGHGQFAHKPNLNDFMAEYLHTLNYDGGLNQEACDNVFRAVAEIVTDLREKCINEDPAKKENKEREEGEEEDERIPSPPREFQCIECRVISKTKLQTCGGCHNRYYCSRKCQKKNWKRIHKHFCSKAKEQKRMDDFFGTSIEGGAQDDIPINPRLPEFGFMPTHEGRDAWKKQMKQLSHAFK